MKAIKDFLFSRWAWLLIAMLSVVQGLVDYGHHGWSPVVVLAAVSAGFSTLAFFTDPDD